MATETPRGQHMATLEEMAQILRERNPDNKPMYLRWMADQWWPGAAWLRARTNHHNGGARVGARSAGGFAGRLEKKGLLRLCKEDGPRSYTWRTPEQALEVVAAWEKDRLKLAKEPK